MLEVLDLGIKLFEYQPRKKVALASAKSGSGKNQPATKATMDDNKERLKSLENAIMNPSAARDMLRRRKEMDSIRGNNWKMNIFTFFQSSIITILY